MTASDGWYAVSLSVDVEPGMAVGTRLDGAELVVWRDQAGAAHVWEDRCPHRGMRLSFGFVRAGRLGCLYHGWQFDGEGRCRLIPAHPALVVPSGIRAATYDCTERLGMIWTRLKAFDGEIALGADAAVFEASLGDANATFDEPAQAIAVRSIAINCDASRLHAALPDHPTPIATTMAVQPSAPGRSMLHLTLAAAAADSTLRLAICDWAEALRDALEATA